MNDENTKRIIDACPSIFCDMESEREKLNSGAFFSPIAFGFECGDGWTDLLVELCTKIQKHISSLPENVSKGIKVSQVKEKFGTLRFYMWFTDDVIESYIHEAEIKSAKTCEVCGAPGEIRGKHWIYCSCEAHIT